MKSTRGIRALTSAVLATAATMLAVQGATNGFYVPTFRGEAGSAVAGWERFTVGIGAPGNAPDLAGSTAASARLTQLDPMGFVTGSGNIYNQDGISDFSIRYQAGGPIGSVVLQTRTVGAELDYSSVRLSYLASSLSGTYAELERAPFVGQGPGAIVSSAWTWDLSGLNASELTISFKAAGPSLSFDSATLDVRSIPEPGTWSLLVCGLAAGGFWLRRRR